MFKNAPILFWVAKEHILERLKIGRRGTVAREAHELFQRLTCYGDILVEPAVASISLHQLCKHIDLRFHRRISVTELNVFFLGGPLQPRRWRGYRDRLPRRRYSKIPACRSHSYCLLSPWYDTDRPRNSPAPGCRSFRFQRRSWLERRETA